MTDGPGCDSMLPTNYSPPPGPQRPEREQVRSDYPLPLTAGNRVVSDTLPPVDGTLTIDKLAFTFDIPRDRWVAFQKWMHRHGLCHRGGRIYREAVEIPDPIDSRQEILIQWAPYLINSVPFVRVEFNPAKATGFEAVLQRHIFPLLERGWHQVSITRIDVAVDYPVALQEHVYFAGSHKGVVYYSDGIETVYLGSQHSDARLRIYDKAKEMALKGGAAPEHPLTRVEAQRRPALLSGDELHQLRNPFRRLQIARPLPAGLPFKFKLYFEHAEKYGVDATLKQLGRYERKRFKELLKAMPPTVRHPAEVFAKRYPHVCLEKFLLFYGFVRVPSDEEDGGEYQRSLAA